MGGGGSILTVPVMVYLMGIPVGLATAYSLFIVGATALVGSVQYMYKGLVVYRTAILFALPSLVAVFFTRRYLMPALPDVLAIWGGVVVYKNVAIMIFFALIMLASALSMIRSARQNSPVAHTTQQASVMVIMLQGLAEGSITGIVGAGGGFLVIPALVLLGGLDIRRAVATSLLIIAIKSILGFLGDVLQPGLYMDWPLLITFLAISLVGLVLGIYLSLLISTHRMKIAFGWFVLAMGVFILSKELFFHSL